MSAKDRRKSIELRVPEAALPTLRRLRRQSRSGSGAAALRVLVERGLALGFEDLGVDPAPSGQAYRLQISPQTRRDVHALAQRHNHSEAYVLTQLCVIAARSG